MRKLKRLIESGSDEELLRYIREDFSDKIDEYLNINGNLTEMKKRYVELAQIGAKREEELTQIIQKLNTVLDELRQQK